MNEQEQEKENEKMNDKITATITATTATINAFNPETNNIEHYTCAVSKQFAERDAIVYCDTKNLIFCEILKKEDTAPIKYEMDAQWFFAHAQVMEKRPQGAYISRTVCVYDVEMLAYSVTSHTAKKVSFKIDTNNEKAIERKAKQVCKANELKMLKVINTSMPTSKLYVMTTEQFVQYGKIVK